MYEVQHVSLKLMNEGLRLWKFESYILILYFVLRRIQLLIYEVLRNGLSKE